MKIEHIKTADDIERYIEGRINDFEAGISDKDDIKNTLSALAEYSNV